MTGYTSAFCTKLVATKPLFTKHEVPEDVLALVEECRKCLAFEQYTAAVALTRTILEKAAIDAAVRRRKIAVKRNQDYFDEYPPGKLFDTVFGLRPRSSLRMNVAKFYDLTSSVIHGAQTADSEMASKSLDEVLGFVSGLYNAKP